MLGTFSVGDGRQNVQACPAASGLPKTVWMYWRQGWDKAPPLHRAVAETWKHHNPGWTIHFLDDVSVRQFIQHPEDEGMAFDVEHTASLADMIRLRLLAAYGGVWADATLVCTMPLDLWAPASVATPAQLWMLRGPLQNRGSCTFLIASLSGSRLITGWLGAYEKYWRPRFTWPNPYADYNYYQLDVCYAEQGNDPSKLRLMNTIAPVRACWGPGNPMAVAAPETLNVLDNDEHPWLLDAMNRLSFAIKLFYRQGHIWSRDSFAGRVVRLSLENKFVPKSLKALEAVLVADEAHFVPIT
jgi:hypothetical protein